MSTSSSSLLVPEKTFIAKYKPMWLRDFHFAADEHFTNVLRECLSLDRIHMLFIGDPDSCKTTFLYAFLREYFQTPSLPENNILFINNLKEQGINYYRNEMKMFCQSYSNIPGKKKFIVIDDIDCIHEQSQQVFRNQIDKYGHNVNYIAVCSSVQKVIESMQSRLQFFRLLPLEKPYLTSLMSRVAKQERLYLEKPAAQFLLEICGVSCRPLLNYLEKMTIICRNTSEQSAAVTRISLAFCKSICTDINPQTFAAYIQCVKTADLNCAIQLLFRLHDQGFSVLDILDYLFVYIKLSHDLDETEKYQIIPFLCKYITVFHNVHEDKIELAFFTNQLTQSFTTKP